MAQRPTTTTENTSPAQSYADRLALVKAAIAAEPKTEQTEAARMVRDLTQADGLHDGSDASWKALGSGTKASYRKRVDKILANLKS